MIVTQYHYINNQWQPNLPHNSQANLLLLFGNRNLVKQHEIQSQLSHAFSKAELMGCTTSGEIIGTNVYDDTLVLTAITFEKSSLVTQSVSINDYENCTSATKDLIAKLNTKNIKGAFILADGQLINGSELADGLSKYLPEDIFISGGLAGDDDRFEETMTWHNNKIESGLIIICGFYGESLKIGHGSLGGWDPFGPERIVTKSNKNILYELDEKPALDLYKSYLGKASDDLPASALLFPLSIQKNEDSESVVRTILNINENKQSMTFAGDIPQGSYARLMKANFERLFDGAQGAAEIALSKLGDSAQLAILVSCVGRRIVLKQRIDDELESVNEVLGNNTIKCGFYSYGEISPLKSGNGCHLHNQSMTITVFTEK